MLIAILGSCKYKKAAKVELALNFNFYTFEPYKEDKNYDSSIGSPTIACNSRFTFYDDSTINVHLQVVKTMAIDNSFYKWKEKNEKNNEKKNWTEYVLNPNESGYYSLNIRRNLSKQIIGVSMLDDISKVVFFSK